MKKSLVILILTAVAATSFASKVTNIELSYENGETVARIDVSGPIQFTHQTVVPRDGKPDRVIIDILSATHELGGRVFEHVPPCPVTAVRTSQFAVKPEAVVRIVFDMKLAPVYQVEAKDRSVYIHFTDKSVTPFPTWSTAQSLKKPATTSTTRPKAQPTASVNTSLPAAEVNVLAEKDRVESLVVSPTSTPIVAAESGPEPTPTTAGMSPTASALDGYPAAVPMSEPVVPAETTATNIAAGVSTPQPTPTVSPKSATPDGPMPTSPVAEPLIPAESTAASKTVANDSASASLATAISDSQNLSSPIAASTVPVETTTTTVIAGDSAPASHPSVDGSLQVPTSDKEMLTGLVPETPAGSSATPIAVTPSDTPATNASTNSPSVESSKVAAPDKPLPVKKGSAKSSAQLTSGVSKKKSAAKTEPTPSQTISQPASPSVAAVTGPVPVIATTTLLPEKAGT
ncbi:MAG: AMIN domain-containing protein, partial [candidate division Zixibacteria bacterium]|nr:AMIN domain-containing protein [candidate division Zixibacteria bacterium]